MSHTLSMKEGFLSEWVALPPKEQAQVGAKLKLLTADPRPDAKTKKQLKYLNRDVYRIRSGDYRVFYTFDDRYVSVLKIDRRDDETYDQAIEAEYLGGPEDEPDTSRPAAPPSVAKTHKSTDSVRTLPVKLDAEFLDRLRIPREFHLRLSKLETEDDLLSCEGVPDELLLRIDQAVFERPIETALVEKELVAESIDDLFRYRDGDLIGFLLRLSAEQEKFVVWALEGGGPTLVKGGPGTGKSTVALYRVRSIIKALKAGGVARPRVLFTTYTNALVTFSRQLLDSLLGADAACVDVKTADSVALSTLGSAERSPVANAQEMKQALHKALAAAQQPGNSLQKRASTRGIADLGVDYLLEEIGTVIEGRALGSCEAYLNAKRPGRRLPLSPAQRTLIWAVREEFNKELGRLKRTTFHRIRSSAAGVTARGFGLEPYDAVVIDEAQDLDPCLLGMLVKLARAPNRVFLTADANQSVYGAGFRWSDVHDSLQFRGRTGVLKANFRSTREIGEAARAYIADGAIEEEETVPEYVHAGPLPAVRNVPVMLGSERTLLTRFFRDAAREFRLPVWAGALLIPTEAAGRRLAADLEAGGLSARFMTGKDLELGAQVIKVITLKSAKGLEFPFVAIAGFENPYPFVKAGVTDEEKQERTAQERRTLFVGMTRAMRALLVSIPQNVSSPLLAGFDPALWNVT